MDILWSCSLMSFFVSTKKHLSEGEVAHRMSLLLIISCLYYTCCSTSSISRSYDYSSATLVLPIYGVCSQLVSLDREDVFGEDIKCCYSSVLLFYYCLLLFARLPCLSDPLSLIQESDSINKLLLEIEIRNHVLCGNCALSSVWVAIKVRRKEEREDPTTMT